MGGLDAVQFEIVQEKAGTLARLGERLGSALAELAAFDAADLERRDELVDRAAEALWYYVVTREVVGLRGTESVLEELGVPREVQLRMGVRRKA